jgi:beta-aspartyl-peptidase (threonine type)
VLVGDQRRRENIAAVCEAARRGVEALAHSASDAVVTAVAYMESETSLNAGRGAVLDADGHVTLDAGFMEGATRRFGAVGCVTRTANPVLLARGLSTEGEHGRFIVGRAADALVERFGATACAREDLVTPAAQRAWRERRHAAAAADTVGAVALDENGRIAAAVSTGGLALKPDGRVGDSAVVGAGFWAEEPLGACVTTGIGEAILREGTARRCVRLLGEGWTPARAARKALGELRRARSRPPCGLIVVTTDGRVAVAHTSPAMTAGIARMDAPAVVRTRW